MNRLDDLSDLGLPEVMEKAPNLSWIQDEVFVYIWGLFVDASEDGYENELDSWGLSLLRSGRIAVGPLCEHMDALCQVSLIEIVSIAQKEYPNEEYVGRLIILASRSDSENNTFDIWVMSEEEKIREETELKIALTH